MFKRIATSALVFGMLATAPPALAAPVCAPREQLVSQLENKYGEAQHGAGLKDAVAVYEIWTSDQTGTWTIMMTRTDGISCIIASGEIWADAPSKPGPEA